MCQCKMQDTRCVSYCSMVKGPATTKTQAPNASTNGGDASRVGHQGKGSYTKHKGSVLITYLSVNLFLNARRETRRPHQCLRFVLEFYACVLWQQDLYHTTKALLAEYLTSYTNSLQLIDCQCFTQCKILQIPPTRNLHTPHTATRHRYGRAILRHRGAEKSVTPTDFSTSLCRIIYCIRPC